MDLSEALPDLDPEIRRRLLDAYLAAVSVFRDHPGDAEVNIGKLCDHVIRALDPSPPMEPLRASEPLDRVDIERWCNGVINHPERRAGGVSLALVRVIQAAYKIRSDRGGAHSTVDPEHMDAALCLSMGRWLLAELIRTRSGLKHAEAAAYVDRLSSPDAPAGFNRIVGQKYAQYLRARPLDKPHHLADSSALTAMQSLEGIETLDDAKLGYLYTSAIHEACDIDFWHSFAHPSVQALAPVSWLATFTDFESSARAREQLNRFPARLREEVDRLTQEGLYALDHPRPVSGAEAVALIEELQRFQEMLHRLPRSSLEASNLLFKSSTRDLVDRMKPLLPGVEPPPGASVIERGENLDEESAAFIFSLCIYLRHRDEQLWRSVDGHSTASATALADIIARPGVGSRFRAAAELALYPAELRERATAELLRSDETSTRELAAVVRHGRGAMLQFIMKGHPLLHGPRKAEVVDWVSNRYLVD